MTIVLDTSIVIDHLRGQVAAREVMTAAVRAGETLVCSALIRVEVLAGMRPTEENQTRRLFDAFEWVAVDLDIAERAGLLANQFLRSHPGVDPVDYVIAATTQTRGATLWTRNVKHFPMFPGLASPY